jgi:hypothetical protein
LLRGRNINRASTNIPDSQPRGSDFASLNSPVSPAVSSRVALLFIVLTATAVIAPLFFLGNPSGHDIQFHLSSWMDAARQWREGIIVPRWSEWANWGFGEPRFIFYPPISWTLGAALGSLLPWELVPGAMIWISLVVAGFSMWILAREWLPGPAAVAAAIFFAADPYHLVMLYYRSDFAELLGAALFPLLFWAALHVARGERRYVPALSLAFAAIWLCNDPAGVMATYSVVLAILIVCIAQRSPRGLFWSALALAAGFALAAFYLFPAVYEQRWVQIASAINDSLQPPHNFLFAHNNELGFVQFNMRVSRVAIAMIASTCIAGVFFARRYRSFRVLWWVLLAVAISSTFIMLPPSLFLWRLLPKLWFVQFPWRWMDTLAIPLAIFVAGAAESFRKRWAFWLVLVIAAAGLVTVAALIIHDAWWDSEDASYLTRGIDAGHGFDGTDEYAPLGVSHWDLPGEPPTDDKEAPPPAETLRIQQLNQDTGDVIPLTGASVIYQSWFAEKRIFTVKTDKPVSLVVRLLNYPAWGVQIDGTRIQPGYVDVTGQMVLPVTTGLHQIDILFRRTRDRTLGIVISLLAAAGLFAFARFFPFPDTRRSVE